MIRVPNKSLLREFGDELTAGNHATAERIKDYIIGSNHATVWNEMKRQQASIPDLRELFNRAPQALTWP